MSEPKRPYYDAEKARQQKALRLVAALRGSLKFGEAVIIGNDGKPVKVMKKQTT